MSGSILDELYVKIGAKLDVKGFKSVEGKLLAMAKRVERQMNKAMAPDMSKYKAAQAEQFKQQLAARKLVLVTQKQGIVASKVQTDNALKRIKAEAIARDQARKDRAEQLKAQAAKLRMDGQSLGNERKRVALQAAQARLQAQQERRERALNRAKTNTGFFAGGVTKRRRGSYGVGGMLGRMTKQGSSAMLGGALGMVTGHAGGRLAAVSQFGRGALQAGVGGAGSVAGAGAGMALTGLASAATMAAQALIAVAGASLAYLATAQQSQDRQAMREAQFRAAATNTKNDPALAKAAEARMQKTFDDLGLSVVDSGADYSKAVSGMAPKMGFNDSQTFMSDLLAYGKSQGADNEAIKGGVRAITQMMGKGSMMSEELRGQLAEHFGAQTVDMMAEAYAKATKSGLTGQKAMDALNKAMQDGNVKGSALIGTLEQFGSIARAKANEGGALDTARNTQESQRNRLSNQWERTSAEAFRSTGGQGIGGAMAGLTDFLQAAQPQFNALAQTGQKFADALGQAVRAAGELIDKFNSFGHWDLMGTTDVGAVNEFIASFKDNLTAISEIGTEVGEVFKEIFGEDGSGLIEVLRIIQDVMGGILSVVELIVRTIGVAIRAYKAWRNNDDTFDLGAEMQTAYDKSIGEQQRRADARQQQRDQDDKMASRIGANRLPGESPAATAQRLQENDKLEKLAADKSALAGQSMLAPTPSVLNQVSQMKDIPAPSIRPDTATPILNQMLKQLQEKQTPPPAPVVSPTVNVEIKVEAGVDVSSMNEGMMRDMARKVFSEETHSAFSNQSSPYGG